MRQYVCVSMLTSRVLLILGQGAGSERGENRKLLIGLGGFLAFHLCFLCQSESHEGNTRPQVLSV